MTSASVGWVADTDELELLLESLLPTEGGETSDAVQRSEERVGAECVSACEELAAVVPVVDDRDEAALLLDEGGTG